MKITITGIKKAQEYVSTLKSGAEAAGKAVVLVGTAVRYGRYVEQGTRRMKAQPYLVPALRAVEGRIGPEVAEALPKGPSAVLSTLLRLGYQVEAGAKRRVPVRTGHLRRSLHTTAGRRG